MLTRMHAGLSKLDHVRPGLGEEVIDHSSDLNSGPTHFVEHSSEKIELDEWADVSIARIFATHHESRLHGGMRVISHPG